MQLSAELRYKHINNKTRVSHLSAVQGSNQVMSEAYKWYGERITWTADTAMRQELGRVLSFAQKQVNVAKGVKDLVPIRRYATWHVVLTK